MKIQKVVLKEFEVIEVDGEFEKRFINEKKHPAFLTNASIKRGFDEGLVESSLWEDLLKVMGLQSLIKNTGDEEKDAENAMKLMGAFDEQKLIAVIYLAVLGANRKLGLSFEDFVEKYHYGLAESIELYATLLTDLLSSNPNQFAKELQNASKKNQKTNQ